jgi:hypothetical protein
MTDRFDDLESRTVATELFIRAILTAMVSSAMDPIGEIERMADEFRASVGYMRVEGAPDDHAEKMLALIRARADDNFSAVRGRIFRDVEIEAGRASKN